MPCLSTKGIFVPAGTVTVFPSADGMEWSLGGGGSFYGVMGPSICCASKELPAKTNKTRREIIGTPREKFTATLDRADICGATFGTFATTAASRRRSASDPRPFPTSLAPPHSPTKCSFPRFQIVWDTTEAELLLVRCLKRVRRARRDRSL